MTGLQRFFIKLTPIIMLICFICLGITHVFSNNQNNNITYLTHETIQINENTSIDEYTFDFHSYVTNINTNTIKKSVTNLIDIETWSEEINTFKSLWYDGYQFGDVSYSVLNSVILVVNGLITVINLFMLPLKLTAGVLLTAMALMGINPQNNGVITRSLNGFIDYVTIPMINPVDKEGKLIHITQTIWTGKQGIASEGVTETYYTNFITYEGQVIPYSAWRIRDTSNGFVIEYGQLSGANMQYQWTTALTNGTWGQQYQTIIVYDQTINEEAYTDFYENVLTFFYTQQQ